MTPDELRNMVNKAVGTEAVMLGSDPSLTVTYLPTGIAPIDHLTGGGLARGRMTVVVGDYSTLKSYIGLRAIQEVQASGGTAALIDTEHSLDPQWAAHVGVDMDELVVQRPPTGELAIDTAEALIRTGDVDLIVFDSIAATLPQAEEQKRLHKETVQPARLAALLSVACRKLTAANSTTAILWINQLRLQVGITFGNPEVAPGGKAVGFYASQIINLKKVGKITTDGKSWDGEKWVNTKVQVAQKFKAHLDKSKINKPNREAWFVWDLVNARVDEEDWLVAQGVEHGLIGVNGHTYEYGQTKKRGREAFKAALTEQDYDQLRLEVLDV